MRGLKIGHMNCRSMFYKQIDIQPLLNNLNICCLGETWLHELYSDNMVLWEGKQFYRQDRISDTVGGGLITYLDNKIFPYSELVTEASLQNGDIECLTIRINQEKHKRLVVMNLYRPPKGSPEGFIDHLKALVKLIDDGHIEIWLLGDINIDIVRDWEKGGDLLDTFTTEKGLSQLIQDVTYPEGNSCLDHIFTNCPVVSHCGVLSDLVSDHYPIAAIRKKLSIKYPMTSFRGRTYKRYCAEQLREDLAEDCWEDFYSEKDPSIQWEIIRSRICCYLDATCPMKDLKCRLDPNEWMSNDIREQMADRKATVAEYRRSGIDEIYQEAKLRRVQVNRVCHDAKSSHVKDTLEDSQGDAKEFWRQLNKIIAPKNRINVTTFNVDGTKLEGTQASEYCNEYFANIGEELFNTLRARDPSLPDAKLRPEPHLEQLVREKGVNVTRVDVPVLVYEDLEKLVEKINPDKSSGLEGISAKVLKDAFQCLIPHLCDMFNKSINQGIFPPAWAKATVIPIPKSGSLTQVNNWRPVSLLPAPGKMIERVMHEFITGRAEELGLISDKQYGFVKGKGTNEAVYTLISRLYENRDKSEITCACYVDFSKAFDSIHHSLLVSKLEKLGLDGMLLKWIASYLQNRKQSVLLNSVKTESKEVLFGVPQGSILGPLLFILYVNGVTSTTKNTDMLLYADDIVITASNKDPEIAGRLLQEDLTKLVQWCTKNGLTINTKKTKTVWYGEKTRAEKAKDINIVIGESPLESPSEYTYLGVKLDNELKLDSQMTTTECVVRQRVFSLDKLKELMDQHTAVLVYKQTILPHFDYCSFLVEGAKKSRIKKQQTLQNRALRVCTRKFNIIHRTKDIHEECGVEMLDKRREAQLALMMFKLAVKAELRPVENPRTRGDLKIKIPCRRAKLQKFKKGPQARGIKLWNRMKPEVQKSKSVTEFKRLFKVTPLDPE